MVTLLALALSATLQATPGPRQPLPACDGQLVIVRVDEIKPGAWDDYLKAAAAHKAWYRANGFTDNDIVVARIIERDKSGKASYSQTKVLSYHFNPPDPTKVKNRNDAAWKAYVKQYDDTSKVLETFNTCMPKH